jgi:hypothetical protein
MFYKQIAMRINKCVAIAFSVSLVCTLCSFRVANAQDSMVYRKVCALSGTPLSQAELLKNAIEVTSTDALLDYLENIKEALGQQNTEYKLLNITSYKTAAALNLQREEKIEAVIVINQAHYSSLIEKGLRKAMFIWLLAHEVAHHSKRDNFYFNNSDRAKNYLKELTCDELAGFAVAALTDNIDPYNLEYILSKILADSKRHDSLSMHYPPIEYRLVAAKTGWIKGKSRLQQFNSSNTVQGWKIDKIKYNDGTQKTIAVSESDDSLTYMNNKSQDFVRWTYNKSMISTIVANDSLFLFLGEHFRGEKHGKGIRVGLDQLFQGTYRNGQRVYGICTESTGEIYEGTFMEFDRNGFGRCFYTNGQVYYGQWKLGKRDGYGILYQGTKVLRAGCWVSDKYVDEKCN